MGRRPEIGEDAVQVLLFLGLLAFGGGNGGAFQPKEKSLAGSFQIETIGDRVQLVFSADFKTKKGPDLKVVLSPLSLSGANGDNAMRGALVLGPLKATKGSQRYLLPADLDLSRYKSVLVHCEKYSVLWGGGNLP